MFAIEEITTVKPNGSLVVHHPELRPGEQVKVIVLLGVGSVAAAPSGYRLKQGWAGGLSDIGKDYTAVELQHKAQEWRGD